MVPKLRKGSMFRLILEPRRRIDRALWVVVTEAYVTGLSVPHEFGCALLVKLKG